MTTTAKPDRVRERILTTATKLFYREGINATGVDRISEVAGVSKRSLYQRFAGKDQLITEYLTTLGPQALDDYVPAEDEGGHPAERIISVFSALREESRTPEFRGCPFVNAAAELSDPSHPGRAVSVEYKLRLQDFFAREAVVAGATDPRALAEQLVMLFDGAMSYALVRVEPVPDSTFAAVRALVEAQTADSGS